MFFACVLSGLHTYILNNINMIRPILTFVLSYCSQSEWEKENVSIWVEKGRWWYFKEPQGDYVVAEEKANKTLINKYLSTLL